MIQLLLLAWLAPQTLAGDAAEHVRRGLEARKQARYDAAIEQFRKAIELAPNLAEVFVYLGETYMQKRDYAAAIEPLRKAVKLSPNSVAAHGLLGYALLAHGFAADAIPHLERAGDKGALGVAQLEIGRLQDAVGNLNAALAERPNDPDLVYYLARASGLLSKWAADALLAAYPDSARAHQVLGENYFVLRQMANAEKEFIQALRLRADLPGVHLALGEVYAGAFQWAKAEEEFRAEARLRPGNAEAAYRLGVALLQQGKIRDARAELERANRLRPGMPETLYSLGKAALLDGDQVVAERAWRKVIEVAAEGSLTAQAHFQLANLYRKQGDNAKAEREMAEYNKVQNAVSKSADPRAQFATPK